MAEYVRTLRSIVLHSGDALPDEVTTYLRRAAAGGDHDLWEEILGLYRPLVTHLPAAYVDFALAVLLPKQRRTRGWLGGPLDDDEMGGRRLGFPYFRLFDPPAPVQGPFLPLLRHHEDEGLRLIHGLANAATARWRERVQRPRDGDGVTPVPTVVELESGRRDFWGDPRVYYWFRPSSTAPDAVGSALMALEVWMEDEVQDGRDTGELFAKVLAGSECAAVLGICVGIALAYPLRSLQAALPLVVSPMVWGLDRARWTGDQQPPASLPNFLRNEVIDKINEERSERPQRKVDIRALAPAYLFGADEALRQAFLRGMERFGEDDALPIPFREWGRDAEYVAQVREDVEVFRLYGDPKNYAIAPVEGGLAYQFQSPPWLQERERERLAPMRERFAVATLVLWAYRVFDTGGVPTSVVTVEEAVRRARELEATGGLTVSKGADPTAEAERLAAIIGVAAAVLMAGEELALDGDAHTWARGVVLTAAKAAPDALPGDGANAATAPYHLRAVAARALCAIAGRLLSDDEVREEIVHLVADRDQRVRDAAVANISNAWQKDPRLCWIVLRLALAIAMVPRRPDNLLGSVERYKARREAQARAERNRVRNLTEAALAQLRGAAMPEPPRIAAADRKTLLSEGGVLPVLKALGAPAVLTRADGRGRLLQVVDDLMAWTVTRNRRRTQQERWAGGDREPYEWNRLFLSWLAGLSRGLMPDETRRHILAPIREAWTVAPQLTVGFMEGFLTQRLAYQGPLPEDVEAVWRELCAWVIRSPEVRRLEGRPGDYRYLPRSVEEAVQLMVFGVWGDSLLTAPWPHARAFIDVWEEWVRAVGHYARPYTYFLLFLDGPGWTCVPEPALRWLDEIAHRTTDLDRLWSENENAARTATLLQRMWEGHEPTIRADPASLERFSRLVDRLATHGSAVAAAVLRGLESRRG